MKIHTEELHKLSNPTVKAYIDMLENTESPPLFHAWALISAMSACLTRRCWFKMGSITIMPNQYIVLVGPAGVRKSSAVKFSRKILKDIPIRYSPSSTAGRMQGLISAMETEKRGQTQEDKEIAEAMAAAGGFNLGMDIGDVAPEDNLHILQRHAVYVSEGELVSFLGMKMDEFITFLGDMWDRSGEDHYEYSLKREKVKLDLPCLNILGGATPTHITGYLPAQAIGQGFTSRVIMVYADTAKRIPWPDEIEEAQYDQFRKILRNAFETFDGAFNYTPQARAAIIKIYDHKVDIDDVRFIHYAERRQTHVLKIAMALAALRMEMLVTEADVFDAHALLAMTETNMAESLGEYGLDKASLARARIKEALKHATEPLSIYRLVNIVGSDVPRVEVNKAAYQMAQDGMIIELNLNDPSGVIKTGYVWPSEGNVFKKHENVAVSYYLDGERRAQPDEKLHRKSAAEKATALLGATQAAPDTSGIELPAKAIEDVSEGLTLAAQGFKSIHEKLASIVAGNNRMRN